MSDSTISTVDQDSHVSWLACKLRHMAHDILQFATYEFNENSIQHYRRYIKDAINFLAGAHTCERFLYGSIGLDSFCDEMIENDLKEFLINIPRMPSEMVTKYNLINPNDDVISKISTNDVNADSTETSDVIMKNL